LCFILLTHIVVVVVVTTELLVNKLQQLLPNDPLLYFSLSESKSKSKINLVNPGVETVPFEEPKNKSTTGFLPVLIKESETIVLFLEKYDL
jgi:hypothetical protein